MAGAENVVRDLINRILAERKAIQKNIEIIPICADGANYTTALYTIKVATENEDLDLFAKVAIIGREMRKQINADRYYQTESFVYLKLVKMFDTLQDKHSIPEEHRFVFPKFYGINEVQGQETVVLEDLASKGYKTYDRFEPLDWDRAAISVEMLAKFHALSFAYGKEHPGEFKELIAAMEYQSNNDLENREQMILVWTKMIDRALSVINDEYSRDKIRDLLTQSAFLEKYNKPSSKSVLCHGDYRLSNILFRSENETLRAIAVDYQTLYSGCPPADLIYFIFMGSDEEFRRQHYDQLVDHYYSNLRQALLRLNVDPVEIYPRETFDKDMKEVLPYSLFFGVTILPIVTVQAESAPRMDGENDVSTFIVETNALYASRFSGIVNDLIRWGVI